MCLSVIKSCLSNVVLMSSPVIKNVVSKVKLLYKLIYYDERFGSFSGFRSNFDTMMMHVLDTFDKLSV